MKKFYNSGHGFYLPSFFFLKINTSEGLMNLDDLSERSKSTLFHEYIHYIQDITTLYGLGMISQVVDTQKLVNNDILNRADKNIVVPVPIDADSPSGFNMELFNWYEGDAEHDMMGILSIDKIQQISEEVGPEKMMVTSVVVSFTGILGNKDHFNFGAVCISEGMANLIEESLFDDVEGPYFPYQIAKKVCDFIYPELAVDPIHVALICDISLNSSHPGKFFVDFISEMHKKQYMPEKYLDLYDRFESYKFTDINGQSGSIYDHYPQLAELAKSQLKDYFTVSGLDDIRNWFDHIIDMGIKFRVRNISFWVDILNAPSKLIRRDNFVLLTKQFGFPLMSNSKDAFYFSHPKIATDQIVLLRAIQEVNKLLVNGQKGCQMKKFCSYPKSKDITSELCDEPWKRTVLENPCPFSVIWHMWGLAGISPIFND